MNINNLTNEEVCGFTVSANRKRLWKCELKMLQLVEKVCNENDINYFLIFGSALGAVRHKGFIPWDDDIDIGMLRKDFDNFIDVLDKYLGDDYIYQYGPRYPGFDCLLRIRDKKTTGITYQELSMRGCKGAFIEVYPFDGVNLGKIRDNQIKWGLIVYKLMDLKGKHISDIDGFIKKTKWIAAKMIPDVVLWFIHEKISRFQNRIDTEYIDCIAIPNYSKHGEGLMNKKDVDETIMVPFEYISARLPKNYDKILSQLYGDYMQLPPKEERGKYHENVVFYDPMNPYTEYDGTAFIKKYFKDSSIQDEI